MAEEQETVNPEPIKLNFTPIFEPFDCGEYDEQFRGQMITLLRNPTMKFRREYLQSNGDELGQYVAAICGCSFDEAIALLDDLDAELLRGLFVGVWEKDTTVYPFVVKAWDRWAADRVKARAAR